MKEKEKVNKKIKVHNMRKKRGSIKDFIIETKAELKKVTWPKRSLVVRASIIIMIIVVFAVIFVGLVDIALTKSFLILKGS